jgi:hypothetical protein
MRVEPIGYPVIRGLREDGDYMTRWFLLAVLLWTPAGAHGRALRPKTQFPVFDATDFAQKPDLTQDGLQRIAVVYPALLWDSSNEANLPDKSRMSALARLAKQSTSILVIDIEEWPLTGDPAKVTESVKKYQTVLESFKAAVPPLSVGLYGVLPIPDYWPSIQAKGSPGYLGWQKENDSLSSIASFADVLFPSVYTFYEDRNGWQKYAIAEIQEARRHAGGKPVYVFLWPQYHVSNKKLANTFLPGDYWRMELETARKYADGIVIWCCSNRQTWNERAPWWLETQGLLKEIGSSQ